jgi:hypothetical protein
MLAILKSRGFWSCATATVAALAATIVGDVPAGPLWLAAGTSWFGFIAATVARKASGVPTSYAGK